MQLLSSFIAISEWNIAQSITFFWIEPLQMDCAIKARVLLLFSLKHNTQSDDRNMLKKMNFKIL